MGELRLLLNRDHCARKFAGQQGCTGQLVGSRWTVFHIESRPKIHFELWSSACQGGAPDSHRNFERASNLLETNLRTGQHRTSVRSEDRLESDSVGTPVRRKEELSMCGNPDRVSELRTSARCLPPGRWHDFCSPIALGVSDHLLFPLPYINPVRPVRPSSSPSTPREQSLTWLPLLSPTIFLRAWQLSTCLPMTPSSRNL